MKTIRRCSVLLLYSMIWISTTYAQSQTIKVKGYIYDTENFPVDKAGITCSQTKDVTLSDSNGVFQWDIPDKPSKLIISHVSYQKKEIKITESMLAKARSEGILILSVTLQTNIKTFQPISISGSRIQLAYSNPKAWILDYELTDNLFVMLLTEGNKKFIRVVNNKDETQYLDKVVSKQYESLHKDCFGNIHLLSPDSAAQTFIADTAVMITYIIARKLFNDWVEPFQYVTDTKILFQEYGWYNKAVRYYLVDKQTQKRKMIGEVIDKDRGMYTSSFARSLFGMGHTQTSFDKWNESNVEDNQTKESSLVTGRKIFDDMAFFNLVLIKPIYQPVKQIDDNIYLFDHETGVMQIFDWDGNTIGKLPITYHKNKQWDKEIIVNEEGTRCFVKYIQDGMVTLCELSPDTGNIINQFTLEKHIYPQKIRIKNNTVYYLYKNLYEERAIKYLWKQPLQN